MSKETLEECVLPEKRRSFFQNYNKFFQCKACDKCYSEWVNVKTAGGHWEQQECCKKAENYSLRTPLLMKTEVDQIDSFIGEIYIH